MDKYDSFLINFKDGLKRGVTFLFGNKTKDKIRNDLFDIVEGFEHYSSDDKNKVFNALTEVSNIHDRNFWDKIVSVLRAS